MTDNRLVIGATLYAELIAHAQRHLPEEACGLLGGLGHQANFFVPVENRLHSPVRFSMEQHQQWQAFMAFEHAGLELVAIMHSHPGGPDMPSPTDLAEFSYPGVYYLIASPGLSGWQITAWIIESGAAQSVELIVKYQ